MMMIMRRHGISTVLFAVVFLSVPALAQRPNRQEEEPPQGPVYVPKKNEVKGPRAIAVLESSSYGLRLVPITIKVDGQFYDATIYKAQPIPMSLDSGVIYEVFRSGEPVGDFTIREAEQNQATGLWHGVGSFVSKADEDRRAERRAKEAAAEAAQKVANEREELGSRPVLKRAQPKGTGPSDTSQSTSTSGSASTSGSSSPSSTQSNDDSDRPVLKKPATTDSAPTDSKPTTAAGPQTAPSGSASSSAPSSPSSPAQSSNDDSGRPVLRRAPATETIAGPWKKQPEPADNKPASLNAATAKANKNTTSAPPAPTTMQVAISDAAPIQPHPYRWEWKDAEEQAKLKAEAEKLALAELSKFAARTSGAKPGNLVDVSFDAFDLNYTNSAVVVLSARALPATAAVSKASAKTRTADSTGLEFYVTVVGRVDIYGEMQKELAVATDNKHLDAYPKMKLIDAVDVDGNGAADLLFRATSDVSTSFVIYRDKGWSLEQVISVQEPKG